MLRGAFDVLLCGQEMTLADEKAPYQRCRMFFFVHHPGSSLYAFCLVGARARRLQNPGVGGFDVWLV